MKMVSGYFLWSFNYLNGRRAMQGNFSMSEAGAKDVAAQLSKKKKRTIVLNGVSYSYSGNTPARAKYQEIARYSNGKLIR